MRMAVAFGKVYAFNPSQNEWPLYVEQLGHAFKTNGITEEAKSEQFPVSHWSKQLSRLIAPTKPRENCTFFWWTNFLNILLPLSSTFQDFGNQGNQSQPSCLNFTPSLKVATSGICWK